MVQAGRPAGGSLRVTGVTLPGTPRSRWGATATSPGGSPTATATGPISCELMIDPGMPNRYRTPDGWRRFATVKERIRVKGAADEVLEVQETIWGPVIDEDRIGRPRALAWTAQHPEAVNLGLDQLQTARTLEEAMAMANRSGIPPQNFTVGGRDGADRLDDHRQDPPPRRLRRADSDLLGRRLPPLGRLALARGVSARDRSRLGADLDGQRPGGGRRAPARRSATAATTSAPGRGRSATA